uniref:NB-ARC domain-containing protein n=1 Tax=Oryza punctata TaxID=4537 RepID=A0A0E0K4H7_ORYPU
MLKPLIRKHCSRRLEMSGAKAAAHLNSLLSLVAKADRNSYNGTVDPPLLEAVGTYKNTVGMEAAVVSGVLKILGSKLAPLVIKEYSSVVGVRKNLKELQDLAEQINCYLETAALGNAQSFNWLKNLKDVAYDVDDVVDEFQLEAEKHETYGDGGIVSKYMYKPKSVISRRKVTKNIKVIKKRFAAIVAQRIDLNAIANSIPPPAGKSVHHMNQTTVEMPLPTVDAASVLGRDQDKNKIITKLTDAKDQQEIEIVSIIGLGGSGKTTLTKLVFNDGDIIEKYFEVRLWVHVAKEFVVTKLFEKLFEAVTKEKSTRYTFEHMREKISKEVNEKRFLLVLDDVWTEGRIQWEQFRREFMVHLELQTWKQDFTHYSQ